MVVAVLLLMVVAHERKYQNTRAQVVKMFMAKTETEQKHYFYFPTTSSYQNKNTAPKPLKQQREKENETGANMWHLITQVSKTTNNFASLPRCRISEGCWVVMMT